MSERGNYLQFQTLLLINCGQHDIMNFSKYVSHWDIEDKRRV